MGSNKRPFNNKNIFNKIDTEEKAYWLGFLYADGSVGSNDNRVELGLAEKDYNHLVKFKNFIGLNNSISYRPQTKSYRYSFKDKTFKENLIKLGCIPQKSLILKFPSEEQVPTYLLRHFMRGYFDGDGHFTNTDSCFEAGYIGTQDFIEKSLERMPSELNLKIDSKIKDVHRKDGAKTYSFYSLKDVYNFLNYLYKDSNIYLDRKYEHYLDFIKNGSKYHKTMNIM